MKIFPNLKVTVAETAIDQNTYEPVLRLSLEIPLEMIDYGMLMTESEAYELLGRSIGEQIQKKIKETTPNQNSGV